MKVYSRDISLREMDTSIWILILTKLWNVDEYVENIEVECKKEPKN